MKPYVAICIPSGGHPHWKFRDNIEDMRFYSLKHGIDTLRRMQKGALVEHNRNLLVNEVLEVHKEVTHILFVDDDMTYPPDTIQKLLRADKDICVAQGFHKQEPYTPMTCVLSPENTLVPVHLNPITEGRVLRVNSCGGGTMLIKRHVFEQVKFPWFLISYLKLSEIPQEVVDMVKGTAMQGHILVGEDVSFLAKAQGAGFDLFCDFSIIVGHVNPDYEVTYRDYERYANERNKGDNSGKS
jgi:hypothetical protein